MPHILIADDEDMLRSVLGDALEEAGFKVFHAENGQAGVAQIRRHPEIDFLLCDIKMPVMGGFALAEEAVKQNTTIKILMMTGFTERSLPAVLAARGIEVWRKPIRIERLIRHIAFLLARH